MGGFSTWWQQLGLVMAGGALGAALRFIIGDAMLRQFGNGFPWGTLTVNLVGAFAVGYVVVWLQTRGSAALYWRAFAIVGIIGGLTTFSSMMLEAVLLVRNGRGWVMPTYLGISLVAGFALVWLGARLAESTLAR
ncbi:MULTISPECIES: fluoride efflux transporter CrcB [Stenotrophomonas]|jgi:fluoride exporter|uniref:fluoride efflux transporter CrcB n=1 Tax=Stenotrophomonas TaxID=40323 RepID=UPI000EC0B40E|nr:fluoride efflux transporter CrcB [Stenotrophomonas rhizophila]UQY89460.1 fluoride efflux transporter CrcB [Stenotrophomonas rhizophila]HBZ46931.1 fluoride efflux transporter CrcB [Stenotrophomonas sp.]